MEWFLRIFRGALIFCSICLALAISFVVGGMVAGSFDTPEQPDIRNVLDQITQDMSIQQLKCLFEENFNCSMETNPQNEDFSNAIWVAPGRNMCSWNNCLIAWSYGEFWSHEYRFYFDCDNKLMGIAEHCITRRLQYPPWPWKWRPRFASAPDQDLGTVDEGGSPAIDN